MLVTEVVYGSQQKYLFYIIENKCRQSDIVWTQFDPELVQTEAAWMIWKQITFEKTYKRSDLLAKLAPAWLKVEHQTSSREIIPDSRWCSGFQQRSQKLVRSRINSSCRIVGLTEITKQSSVRKKKHFWKKLHDTKAEVFPPVGAVRWDVQINWVIIHTSIHRSERCYAAVCGV